jgi:hypothetical protein
MIFDHLFGTYAKEDPDLLRGKFGVHECESRTNPVHVLAEGWLLLMRELRRERNWRRRFARLLYRPGYRAAPAEETALNDREAA